MEVRGPARIKMSTDSEKGKLKNNKESKRSRSRTFIIKSMSYVRSFTRQEVLIYIERLHKLVRRQEKRLKKYKNKLKLLPKGAEKKVPESDCKEEAPEKNKVATFIDEIREAAESVQNQNGFIFEPTSGLYYDQKTGYYYNAEYGLYYDGNTGCYYKYNQENNEFQFHSQVETQETEEDKINKYENEMTDDNGEIHPPKSKKLKKTKTKDVIEDSDQEDGEILTSSEDEDKFEKIIPDNNDKYEDIAKKYPPSLRIIVQETNLPKLKEGSLHIITYKGGTLGREGDHDVIIPDVNISKYHLKFSYNEDKSVYQCADLGSRNGTILNGKRMSNAKQESEPIDLVHGSILQISQTKLLCHVHQGNSTCGHCEPGLLISLNDIKRVDTLSHKEQLKQLQKRYGLENDKYTENKNLPDYNDRAAARRDTIGSTNEHEKTDRASLETEISSDNKGFKLLSKLGWNKGETLGKSNEGLLEPVQLFRNEGTKGLGCNESLVSINLTKIDLKKANTWKKAQQRYKNLPNSNMFADSDSGSGIE